MADTITHPSVHDDHYDDAKDWADLATGLAARFARGVADNVKRHGLTMAQLCAATKRDEDEVQSRLRGEAPFDIDDVAAIADLLDCKVWDLFPVLLPD